MAIKFRRLDKTDARGLVKLAGDKRIWNNLRDFFPHPYALGDALSFIAIANDDSSKEIFAISLDSAVIGVIGVYPLGDVYKHTAEIGYWIGVPYWGQGYATTAVNWMTEYAWTNTALIRLEAGVFEYNQASMRVLEKCGYHKEAIKRKRLIKNGVIHDEHLYVSFKP